MKALKYLNKYLFKYRYRLAFGILCSMIAQIFALVMPRLIGQSLNVVEQYQKGVVTNLPDVKHQLFINIIIIIGAVIVSGIFTFGMRQMIIVVSRYIEFDLKNEIYQQYQRLSLNFYKKNKTGDLMNRISEDVSQVRMYFGPAIMYTINMLTLFIIVVANMIRINTELTLYTLIPLPILSLSIFILSSVINNRSTIVQQYLSKLTAYAQETFSGINVIKAYGIEAKNYDEFDDLAEISKEKNISLYKAQALFFPLMILLIGISNIFVVYFGGVQYLKGTISLSVIAEFIIYINMLTWPVAIVGWVSSMVQQAEASQKRINEFLEIEPEIINYQLKTSQIIGEIEFKNVCVTYDDTKITALKNVSFKIEAGKTLAILGKTGSGKSTIVNLISRLYDIDSGEILIDGVPIKNINLKNLRENIGFVPQDSFLFSDTIANNIRFGDEAASIEMITNTAKQAYIHHNIEQFKDGYQTLIGERGVTLSGGQKQRVSIARALIKDPRILIFDDCLSAVDTETEEKILSNLNALIRHKTAIIVSHRASSVKNADMIIVLDEGRIIQNGTHQQLLSQKGYYQELYEQQLAEQN